MADDIKRVGIEITAEGAKEFTASMKDIRAATKEAYSELKLAQSQYDKNTSSTKKLEDRQKYLSKVTEEYTKKAQLLEGELKELENAENRDEAAISKKRAELNQCKAKLAEYEKGLKDVNEQLSSHSAQLKDWGEKLKTVGGKMTEVGKTLTTHVTAPIVAAGAASVVAFREVDAAMDTVTTKTGATGDALEDMQQRVKNIAESIPTDFQTAADAVGEVNTRFGVTGDELEELSKQFVEFAQINETDVSSSIDSVQSAMAAWGVETENAGKMLDLLNKAGQDTGVSVDRLADLLKTNKTALDEMGFSVSDSAMFLANLDKNGVDASTALTGLRKALQNASKDGKTSKEALDELQEKMGEGTDKSDAYATAIELFGAKAGPAIADAVREGRLSFEELGTTLEDYAGSVGETFDATVDPLDQLTTAMNTAKDLGYEIVQAAAPMIVQAMTMLRDVIQGVKEKWDGLSEGQQEMILKIAGIAAAVGPLLVILGSVVGAIGSIVSAVGILMPILAGVSLPIIGIVAAVGLAIAAGVAIVKNWDKIKEKAGQLRDNIKGSWENIKKKTSEAWSNVKENVTKKVTELKEKALGKIGELKTNAVNKFNELKSNAVSKFEELKGKATEKIESLRSKVKEKIDKIKGFFTGLKPSELAKKFGEVKEKAVEKINQLKEKVDDIIGKIKSKFDITLPHPKLKLPHPKISGKFSLDPPSVPHFSVDWYEKATKDLYMLDGATIFGAMGGKALGGGEAGREILVGEQKAIDLISKASGNKELIALIKYLIRLLEYYLPKRTGPNSRELDRMLGALL